MNKLYFTSDTHFGHANIIQYCKRPFADVQDMNAEMIQRWNSKVGYNDTIYHIGDFAFLPKEKLISLISRLNGKIHLIYGNHDEMIMKDEELQTLFASVSYYKEVRHDNKKIVLCHYGMRVWNKSHNGSIMLYGHSHGNLPGSSQSMDVGSDTNNFYPYEFQEILTKLKKLPPYKQEDFHE